MKKLIFISLAVLMTLGFLTQSCKKDVPVLESTPQGEIVFNTSEFGFKSGDPIPECNDTLEMSYAKFIIDGVTYKKYLQIANGQYVTKALQLDTGIYVLTHFAVFDDNGTPGDETDDIPVMAAPQPGTKYYDLMVNKVPISIHIEKFKKVKYYVDVVCVDSINYTDFGFVWFELNKVVVHELCVFGNICTLDSSLYENSLYEQQSQGLQYEMPAIFNVLMYKDGILQSTFSNEAWFGEGECLSVHWADDIDLPEEFYMVIKTLMPAVGGGMAYITTDSVLINPEDGSGLILNQGVYYFHTGDCDGGPGIYGCAALSTVPPNPISILKESNSYLQIDAGTGDTTYVPADQGTYATFTFSNVPSGYSVTNGDWAMWCVDKAHGIGSGITYQSNVVSSVNPLPSGFLLTRAQVNQINYIWNHLQTWFPGIDPEDWLTWNSTHDGDWYELQTAFWMITDGIGSGTHTLAQTIYDEASQHPDYNPTGMQEGALFIDTPEHQLLMIYVECD